MIVAIGFLGGGLFALFGSAILPPRYLSDGTLIQSLAQGAYPSDLVDRSYSYAADVYRLLGLAGQPFIVGLLTYALFSYAVFRAVRAGRFYTPHCAVAIAVALTLVIGGIYVCQYSKEMLVVVISILLIQLPTRRYVNILLLATILGYAAYMRTYWFLVAAAFVVLMWSIRHLRGQTVVLLTIGTFIMLILGFHIFLGVNSDSFREIANQNRVDQVDVNTLIHPLLPVTDLPTDVMNALLVAFMLVFPIPLLLKVAPLYSLAAAAIAAGWLLVLRRIAAELVMPPGVRSPKLVRTGAFLISFLLVQSIFEPDYGSYLKHLAPLLPVLVFVIASPLRVRAPGDESDAGRQQGFQTAPSRI